MKHSIFLLGLSGTLLCSCNKINPDNTIYKEHFYGTVYNISNGDTLNSYDAHIQKAQQRDNITFSSEELEKANVSFKKNDNHTYETIDDTETTRITITGDTMLHFNYEKSFLNDYKTMVFEGIRK